MSFPDPYPAAHWPSATSELEGIEFDWFARDRDGQLAVFTSAGSGFIPHPVISGSVEAYNAVVAAIASRETSPADLVCTEGGRLHDWREYAEHGLFAYDFRDVHRTSANARGRYDLIYRPSAPVTILNLPERIAAYLPVINVVFGTSDLIPMSLVHELDAPHA